MSSNLYDHPQPVELANTMSIEPASTRPGPAQAFVSSIGVARCRPTTRRISDPLNADETTLHPADFRGNYHKGLAHGPDGLVVPGDYQTMVAILGSHAPNSAAYENMPLDLGRPLTNPQAGKATDVLGPDPKKMQMLPAPTVDSRETAVEAIELYWMALLRDKAFANWPADTDVAAAAAELTAHESDFHGPTINGIVTPQTLFRGCTPGDNVGPYLSQFLLRDIPYGSLTIGQRQRTAVADKDYLVSAADWLAAQNGQPIDPTADHDATRRYIRNLRDLAEYVHVDALYEGYLNACLILLGAGAPLNPGNPYTGSATQIGFGTWGGPHILSLVCEVATRALKCVWWQKWYLHRRLRPEAFGGLVQFGLLDPGNPVLGSAALAASQAAHGSSLMPMAFPEGSPTHPAYGAGHATVAGACVTVLKAFFDEDAVITDVKEASPDGLSLIDVGGTLTVGGELNKLAGNVALGRNAGGVHWRSDYTDSIALGERIAIHILKQQSNDYHEAWSARFTKFDGSQIVISAGEEFEVAPAAAPAFA